MINVNKILWWLDVHRQSYFWLVGGLIVVALAVALRPLLRDEGPAQDDRRHDWWWGAVILVILAAGRWPNFLVNREFNPDESQMLAGARALLPDPVFWRAVDGGTAGPLDFFALWPAGLVLGWNNYLAVRCTALALVATTLILGHQVMALILGRRVARVAGLGAVCFEALTNGFDFLHYSTELLPVTLIAGAAYAATRRWLERGSVRWNGLGGLLLGAVPLAKLQLVPLAAIMGLGWLVAELWFREPGTPRRTAHLMAGALLPVALFAGQITAAGEWWNVRLCYFHANLSYVASGDGNLRQLLERFLRFSVEYDSLLHLWLPGTAAWALLLLRPRWAEPRALRCFAIAAFASCLLAAGSVLYPGRAFLHYCQILVLPFTFLLGALTANLLLVTPPARRGWSRGLVAACAVLLIGTLLGQRYRAPNLCIGALTFFKAEPRTELANHVAAHAQPGETAAVWGWSAYVYVEADLLQAVRAGNFSAAIKPGPYQNYFRQVFLVDVMHSQPALFVDSSGSCSSLHKELLYRHDQDFPELAAWIAEHYVLVDEVTDARIYRRKDLVTR